MLLLLATPENENCEGLVAERAYRTKLKQEEVSSFLIKYAACISIICGLKSIPNEHSLNCD